MSDIKEVTPIADPVAEGLVVPYDENNKKEDDPKQ